MPELIRRLALALGDTYDLKGEIGRGGMSRVIEAEEMALGRRVVIKILPPELTPTVNADRFRRETRIAAQLRHPHIVPLYAAGEADGLLYYTMPFIVGESLRARLDRGGAMPVRESLRYATEVADALDLAHRHGVVHRDMKPENILLEQGHAVVVDFGIALAVEQASTSRGMTATGLIIGTPAYMSPEQAAGERVDSRSDIFSLACVIHEMLSGKPPFHGPSVQAIIASLFTVQPVLLSQYRSDVPEGVALVIAQALAKNPAERFQTAGEFRDALITAVEAETGGTPLSATPPDSAIFSRPAPLRTSGARATQQIASVAVLPFENSSGDPDGDYLSDGLTETIINKMASLPGLRVVPRSTVFRYRDRIHDLLAVGVELKVQAMVTGRVAHRGNTLIVSTELIDARLESQIWGQQYIRPMADVFAIQEEMASEITQSLRVKVSGEDMERLRRRSTENPEAYRAYLRGRFHWNKRTALSVRRATEFFQQAIELDPEYGAAHSGLADCWNAMGYYNMQPPRDAYPRAKAAAERALEIGETVAEGHASLGFATLFFDRDWGRAQSEFLRAIQLKPDYATAHQWYAWYLLVVGRFDDALAAMRRAIELDPLSLVINDHLSLTLLLTRQHHAAVEQARKTTELDPTYPLAYWRLGDAYLALDRIDDAVTAYGRMAEMTGGRFGAGYHGLALGLAGRCDEARQVLARIETLTEGYPSPLERALVLAALDDRDAAFAALDQAWEEVVSDLSRFRLLPWPQSFRADPRFEALADRLKLPRP